MASRVVSDGGPRSANLKQSAIALLAVAAILLHLILRFLVGTSQEIWGLPVYDLPLIAVLIFGGPGGFSRFFRG